MAFPTTTVGGVEVSRLICGSNTFFGYSHFSAARDRWLRRYFTLERIVEVMAAFAKHGVNAVISPNVEPMFRCLQMLKDQTGQEWVWICTPWGEDPEDLKDNIRWCADHGAKICMPHTSYVDARVVPAENRIVGMEEICAFIREQGMIPGLSTHRPEAIRCADESGLDVETYIAIYNPIGFLCPLETDWMQRVINNAKKPVMCIKPLAAGRVLPPTGLRFVFSTIRPIDMVCLGCLSPEEVDEDVAIVREVLEGAEAQRELQYTRSKKLIAG